MVPSHSAPMKPSQQAAIAPATAVRARAVSSGSAWSLMGATMMCVLCRAQIVPASGQFGERAAMGRRSIGAGVLTDKTAIDRPENRTSTGGAPAISTSRLASW